MKDSNRFWGSPNPEGTHSLYVADMYYLTYKIFPPSSWKFLVYFLFAFDTESHYVSPTGLELSEICLLSAEIKAHIPSLGGRDVGDLRAPGRPGLCCIKGEGGGGERKGD